MEKSRAGEERKHQGYILKAAIDLFSRKGFENTSVESITRRAKIAKGTFYNFFEKKEDVLLYFLDREYSKSEKEIEQKLIFKQTFLDQIELSIAAYIKHIFPDKEFTKVLIKELGLGK